MNMVSRETIGSERCYTIAMIKLCRIDGCGAFAAPPSTLCESHIQSGRCFIGPPQALKSVRVEVPRSSAAESITNIYAIRMGAFVKIGRARLPEQRLRDLQIGNPIRLLLLGFVLADASLEQRIHRLLRPERAQGEWFLLKRNTRSVVRMIKTKNINGLKVICGLTDEQAERMFKGTFV